MNMILSVIWLLIGGRTYRLSGKNASAKKLALLCLSLSVFVYCNPVSFSSGLSTALTLLGIGVQAVFLSLVFYTLGQKSKGVASKKTARKGTRPAPSLSLAA